MATVRPARLVGWFGWFGPHGFPEWPQLTVRAIDLERSERSARELGRVLCDELIMGGNTLNTGLGPVGSD